MKFERNQQLSRQQLLLRLSKECENFMLGVIFTESIVGDRNHSSYQYLLYHFEDTHSQSSNESYFTFNIFNEVMGFKIAHLAMLWTNLCALGRFYLKKMKTKRKLFMRGELLCAKKSFQI